MLISYEILSIKPIVLSIGAFFETSLYQDGEYVKRSFASDNYHVNTKIFKDSPLSALGRNSLIQIPLDELPPNIQYQKPISLRLSSTYNLEILCKTNIFLSKENFCEHLKIVLKLDNLCTEIFLAYIEDNVKSIDYGRYLINLTNIININMKKSAQ